jgi:hypothetical protein
MNIIPSDLLKKIVNLNTYDMNMIKSDLVIFIELDKLTIGNKVLVMSILNI